LKVYLLVAKPDLARVRPQYPAEDFDCGGLAGALSPGSAWAAPVSTAKLASTSAFVAPKAFDELLAFKARPSPGIASSAAQALLGPCVAIVGTIATQTESQLPKPGLRRECGHFSRKVVANPGWFASIYSPELPGVGLEATLNRKPEN
jgi:hypothetical protein